MAKSQHHVVLGGFRVRLIPTADTAGYRFETGSAECDKCKDELQCFTRKGTNLRCDHCGVEYPIIGPPIQVGTANHTKPSTTAEPTKEEVMSKAKKPALKSKPAAAKKGGGKRFGIRTIIRTALTANPKQTINADKMAAKLVAKLPEAKKDASYYVKRICGIRSRLNGKGVKVSPIERARSSKRDDLGL